MNTDIRLAVGFWEHPKTVKLIRRLGLEGPVSLQRLWLWATQNRPDGVLSGMDAEDIEIASRWNGECTAFYDVLTELGFVDVIDGIPTLHGWQERNSWQAESDLRAGKSRLSRLARSFPDAHKNLVSGGRVAITEAEYALIRSNNGRTTVVQRILNDRSSPFQCLSNTFPIPEPKKEEEELPGDGEDADSGQEATPRETAYMLPLRSKAGDEKLFPVTEELFNTWVDAFPLVDVRSELKRIKAWLVSNPKKRPASDMPRFVDAWLGGKQNDKARQAARASPASSGWKSPAQLRLESNMQAGEEARDLLFGKTGDAHG
jgi:hypothetical protein